MTLKNIIRLAILSGFLFLILPLSAQQKIIHWQLEEVTSENVLGQWFQEASFIDDSLNVPVYMEEVLLPEGSNELEYRLTNQQFETVELKIEGIGTEIKPVITIVTERKQKKARVCFIPLRLNPENGKLEKLVSFEANLNFLKNEQKNITASGFAATSVLASGKWYKIGIAQTGIYKISYQNLREWGLNPDKINPQTISLHSLGGKMLPESNSQPVQDDLPPVAIEVIGEEDGVFDPQDYILFYGESPHKWIINILGQKLNHQTNLYEDTTYYYLTYGVQNPLRIQDFVTPTLSATHRVDEYIFPLLHENNDQQLTKSGKEWYGETFDENSSQNFTFIVPNHKAGEKGIIEFDVAGRSFEANSFVLSYNQQELSTISLAGMSANLMTGLYARKGKALLNFTPQSDTIIFNLTHLKNHLYSLGYLNYIEVNVTRHLIFNGHQMPFTYMPRPQTGQIPEISLQTTQPDLRIWLVDDLHQPQNIPVQHSDTSVYFKIQAYNGHYFIAFDGSSYYTPTFIEEVHNQNLHALQPAEYIIITPASLWDEANRLAQIHREKDGISALTVNVEQIYNEFSSGAKDPVAIRNFMRMLYERAAPGEEPRYLLLFGDGSYDPKHRIPGNKYRIPTFQSQETLDLTSSFVCDDFYGLLDHEEGLDAYGAIDVGVGRFPVYTVEEAKNMVDNVENYLKKGPPAMLPWRNTFCFIADDEDGNEHLKGAEKLAKIIDTASSTININKIYIDAYKQYSTPNGNKYPDANKAITEQVNQGALFINYTGHGGETGWAHENILTVPEIVSWDNKGKMPIFVTATCEFSRYDDPERVSAGEHAVLLNDRGGIALFTTTRLSFSHTNNYLNQSFYITLFQQLKSGDTPRMGDLIRLSKNKNNNNIQIRNFTLLGDPALTPAFPQYSIKTTHINDIPVEIFTDTLKACQKVKVAGEIVNEQNQVISDFNGDIFITVFDKKTPIRTLANDQITFTYSFQIQNKQIAYTVAPVINGKFEGSFILPKDINLNNGNGKFSFYATDSLSDAAGAFTNFIIGGIDETLANDNEGPEIEMFLDDKNFAPGNLSSQNPVLFASLADSSGINSFGYGLGRNISAWIDGQTHSAVNLNDFFEPLNVWNTRGNITYTFHNLESGDHTLTLRAWDLQGNSNQKSIEFTVAPDASIKLWKITNHPNPFSHTTNFYFEHNQPGNLLRITIHIFNFQGIRVKTLISDQTTTGYGILPIQWDGRSESGDLLPSGMYLYQIIVENKVGTIRTQSQKLMIVRNN
ncbi:MAG TPA: type IX secretion system sortase PorU [Bacteroidales bacterium]|nr:type IX secretion system sortase PorU [Bacteroidales bacterium]